MNRKTPLRIYHPWWKWECYKSGFFSTSPPDGMDLDRAKTEYPNFFRTPGAFAGGVVTLCGVVIVDRLGRATARPSAATPAAMVQGE